MDKDDTRRETEQDDLPATDRREFLKAATLAGGAAVAFGALSHKFASAQDIQVAQATPVAMSDKPWWPHPRWGKDDQAGASNHITPAKVLDTAKWIKDGKIYRI